MTHLRQAMLEELQRRNCATTTVRYYIQAVERFAKHFHRPPDLLNQAHLREYQAYLLRDRKLEPRTRPAADASGFVQTALSKVTRRACLRLDTSNSAPGHSR